MRTVYVVTWMRGIELKKQEVHTDPRGAKDSFVKMQTEAAIWPPLAGAFASAESLVEGMTLMASAGQDTVLANGCEVQG